MDESRGGVGTLAHAHLKVAERVPVVKQGDGLDALLVEVADAEVAEEDVLYLSRHGGGGVLKTAVARFLVAHLGYLRAVTGEDDAGHGEVVHLHVGALLGEALLQGVPETEGADVGVIDIFLLLPVDEAQPLTVAADGVELLALGGNHVFQHGLAQLMGQHVVNTKGHILIATPVDGQRTDVHRTVVLVKHVAAVASVLLGDGVEGSRTGHALGDDAEVLYAAALAGLHKF